MKVIVCGSRHYGNKNKVNHSLNWYHAQYPITLLIEGGQTGADTLAGEWADENGIDRRTVHADWNRYKQAAGPIRNGEMLKLDPDMVIAFPGQRGTRNMIKQAEKAGVKVWKPYKFR